MYKNIGKKLKSVAIIATIIGILACIATGIVLAIELSSFALGIIFMIGGSAISCLGSFFVYGFGELIDKVTLIAENTKTQTDLQVTDIIEQGNNSETKEKIIENYQFRKEIITEDDNEDNVDDVDNQYLVINDDDKAEEEPSENECPLCFSHISSTDTVCPECGYDLTLVCSKCGSKKYIQKAFYQRKGRTYARNLCQNCMDKLSASPESSLDDNFISMTENK